MSGLPSTASILLVDDDRLVLATLCEGLSRAGYRVTGANDGEEALRLAREQPFDLALVDMRMPGLSGADLATRLLAECNCHCLILSAYADHEFVRDAASRGALGYLIKPIDAVNLSPAIESALARAAELAKLRSTQEHLNVALQQGRNASIAIGILMERFGLEREVAFARLRDEARSSRRRMSEVADELVQAVDGLNRLRTT